MIYQGYYRKSKRHNWLLLVESFSLDHVERVLRTVLNRDAIGWRSKITTRDIDEQRLWELPKNYVFDKNV